VVALDGGASLDHAGVEVVHRDEHGGADAGAAERDAALQIGGVEAAVEARSVLGAG